MATYSELKVVQLQNTYIVCYLHNLLTVSYILALIIFLYNNKETSSFMLSSYNRKFKHSAHEFHGIQRLRQRLYILRVTLTQKHIPHRK